MDYYNKKIRLKNTTYSIQIWDTNGWEYDRQFLNPQIYKICSLFIILCSFDNYESFSNLESWFDFIGNLSRNLNKTVSHLIPVVLLINKNDLKGEKKFKITDVNHKIKNLNFNIWTYNFSAKDNNYKDILDKIDSLVKEDNDTMLRRRDKTKNFLTVEESSSLDYNINLRNTSSAFKIKRASCEYDRDLLNKKSCC